MSDPFNNIIAGRAPQTTRPSGYRADTVRDVQTRANVLPQNESAEDRNNLRRLNASLSNEQPLRDDVPRGYYLNITV